MTSIFHVSAKDERRLYSRLLLVLEQQMVPIQVFHAEVHEGRALITFVIIVGSAQGPPYSKPDVSSAGCYRRLGPAGIGGRRFATDTVIAALRSVFGNKFTIRSDTAERI